MVEPSRRPTKFQEAPGKQGEPIFGTRQEVPSLKDGRLYFKVTGDDGIESYTGILGWFLSLFGVTEALPNRSISDGKTISDKVVYVRVKDADRWCNDHKAPKTGEESDLYTRIQRVIYETLG